LYVTQVERIASDPAERRRLLWLRARERRDHEAAAVLQRAQPGLLTGFEDVRQRADELDEQREYERSRGYARLWRRLLAAAFDEPER
jgi:hypothetical protein